MNVKLRACAEPLGHALPVSHANISIPKRLHGSALFRYGRPQESKGNQCISAQIRPEGLYLLVAVPAELGVVKRPYLDILPSSQSASGVPSSEAPPYRNE